jgi:hypothetical protein
MRKPFVLVLLTLALIVKATGQDVPGYKPKDGFVPDSKTAIAVAEAVLKPIYGEDKILAERPFSAHLDHGIWIVTGHLPDGFEAGGVAEARIRKSDAAILYVLHGK